MFQIIYRAFLQFNFEMFHLNLLSDIPNKQMSAIFICNSTDKIDRHCYVTHNPLSHVTHPLNPFLFPPHTNHNPLRGRQSVQILKSIFIPTNNSEFVFQMVQYLYEWQPDRAARCWTAPT